MFSAYDLKKIIPRAIFALVAVNLSWGLMEIFINGVQAIGDGAQQLVMAPFGPNVGVELGGTSNLAFSAIIAGAAGAALIGIIPVVGVAVSGLFGLLFAFGIIMLRKIMLIGLIIIAPVAIALSVFPQTESWAKKWWDWFSKLLLMYPFIMAFFGISEVAAGIISGTTGSEFEELIYKLGAVVILIMPYFLVGKALSLAGGAIGKVAGMVNNKDRGIIDRTKKWEGAKVAERRADAKAGTRYGGRNFVTRSINRSLRATANPRSVIGSEGNRDARVLSALQTNASTMEGRHEGAKSLNKDELQVLAAVSNETEAGQVIENLAAQRALDNGTNVDTERSILDAAYRSGKTKVGGSVDGGSQYYALQRAVAEGALNPEQAAQAVQRMTAQMATSGAQRTRLAETIEAQLDGAASGAGYLPNAVSRHATAQRTGVAPAPMDQATVEGIFRGPQALTYDKLGGMKTTEFTQVTAGKEQAHQDSVVALDGAADVGQARAILDDIIRHRADLVVAQRAAAKANNSQVATEALASIQAMDARLRAATTAGASPHTAGLDLDYVTQQSQAQAQARLGL